MLTRLLQTLWRDEVGATVTLEHVMVGTVGTLALVGGIASTSNALNDELDDFARAIRSFDQSYSVSGYTSNGTTQIGIPGCVNGGFSSGTTFGAYKAGSGFRQTSTEVSSGRARLPNASTQVIQETDLGACSFQGFEQPQQFTAVPPPAVGFAAQPQAYALVEVDDGVLVEEAVTTQQVQKQAAQDCECQKSTAAPAPKEAKTRRKARQ